MKILLVRHCDPDYSIDSLTEIGKKESELLAKRLVAEKPAAFYCSVMGRARDTIKPALKELNMTAEYCEWLQEFHYARVSVPYEKEPRSCWDILPEYINKNPKVYEPSGWRECDFIKNSNVAKCYDDVCAEFDKVLIHHGYRRDGLNYIAESPNHDTLVFACHFGLIGVLYSHLTNCSPYSVWQNAIAVPSSVSVIYTEERIKGIASMRASCFGDTSHLYAGGRQPEFAGRFCECFADDTRH